MSLIKSLWPMPFNIKKGNIVSFIVWLVIFLVVLAVVEILLGILGAIPVVGLVAKIVGRLLDIYSFVGVILCITCVLGITK